MPERRWGNRKLGGVNGRLDKVEERIDDVEIRLARIKNRVIVNHENHFDRLEDRIRVLETSRK